MTTTEHNPFDTAAPGQSTPAPNPAPVGGGFSEFASPGADLADPFASPSGGSGVPFPRCTDLIGRVIALRKLSESMEENPFSKKTPKETQKIFTCHLVVFTGGMVTTTDRRDAADNPDAFSLDGSSDLPMVEVGEPILLVENWRAWNAGILNKFRHNPIIIGRLVRLPRGKQAKAALPTWQAFEKWAASGPSKELWDQAGAFWTIIPDESPEEHEMAVKWYRSNSPDAQTFRAPIS